ncbi:unnamed protein product [Lactuca saligna]|uniref:Uncharacterized protein n=1 Tax=Lactuca saligna TaxID=75948 RepID=A0AA35YQD7_LACSI|nr:unnamed protein product [Lactuca saligna]
MVKTVSRKHELSDEDDSYFQSRPGSSKKPKRESKVLKKDKKVAVIKEFPSLKNRCSPGSLLGVIQGLSREHKDCVRAMGFGSLLGMKMIDVSLKIVYYVLDHFNFETLKVEFENCQVSVESKSVQEMLGLPSGGSLLSNMDYISENHEESCMFEWKKQYENIDKLRLKQLKNELVRNNAAYDNFRINFLVLFINTLCESISMGKCNLNPLYLIRRDIYLSSIDRCDYIVDYLLLYVETFKFDHLQVTRKRPTIFYWTSEKIRFHVDILQASGGFGCGHVNETYVEEEFQESKHNEEESGVDEDESYGEEDLCDEDEEDFDVNKVSNVEACESKISCMYQKMEDLKKDLIVKIDDRVLKFPQKTVEECSNKYRDSNETQSSKNEIVPSFSLGFIQDSEGSKKSSRSQISFEQMRKKKIKDRVYLGKLSAGRECVIPNVNVIDASPVSLHPIWTLSFEYNHLNETAKYKIFKESFCSSVYGDRDLKDVDMKIFPILTHKHIYVIVINLKKSAFEVIDNGADDADFDDKYGVVFKTLSYYVEKGSKWKYGLPKKGASQEKILEKLRMKYAATILTSEINTKRNDVLKVAYEYQKVDLKIRGKHAYDTQWNIETRLSRFF